MALLFVLESYCYYSCCTTFPECHIYFISIQEKNTLQVQIYNLKLTKVYIYIYITHIKKTKKRKPEYG